MNNALLNRQLQMSRKILPGNANIISARRQCECFCMTALCIEQNHRIITAEQPEYLCCSACDLQVTRDGNIIALLALYGSAAKQVFCFRKILVIRSVAACVMVIAKCSLPG